MTWNAKIFTLTLCILGSVSFASVKVPQKFLNRSQTIPAKVDSRFSARDINSGNFVTIKNQEWSACHKSSNRFSAWALSRDPVSTFIEGPLHFKKLQEIESLGLTSGKVEVQPWSGDYWAYAAGIIAARYRDPEFIYLWDWKKRFDLVTENPASKIISSQGQQGINTLSPAEKYDLLVGDQSGGLTSAMWNQGKKFFDEYGNVESWMGICHGWAPASIMEPRPAKTISVPSTDGKWQVSLNPSDIKGLVSYSWATNRVPTVTLGNRCNKKNPPHDENGRIKDSECFDLNPATWHLVTTHMVGMDKRSFVMDATYDYEVWNQPVLAYSYTYFNPQTRKAEQDLQSATVKKEDFTQDKFKKYRPMEARSFVGIRMKVGYVVETMANEAETDSEQQDAIRWVSYEYDLELDDADNIIGGEWYIDSHPDFVWNPKREERPWSVLDKNLSSESWTEEKLPGEWTGAAHQGSPYGVIINTITEALLKKSANN
ncbi:MAG: hypothetical protein ACXVCP_09155 [Bdellovibrio sp.]